MESLLPKNASQLELNIEAVGTHSFNNIPVSKISNLWNPATCDKALLPYLAWALSVDNWNSDWKEAAQRQVIADSVKIHSIKGTRGAVEFALSSFAITTEIEEWHEQEPAGQPGTFKITAWTGAFLEYPEDNVLIGPDTITEIRKSVDNAKRHSQHYELFVGVKFGVHLSYGCFLNTKSMAKTTAKLEIPHRPLTSRIRLLTTIRSRSRCTTGLHCQPVNEIQATNRLRLLSTVTFKRITATVFKLTV